MPSSPALIFLPPNTTFTSNGADTIVAGGFDTITMLAPDGLAFGLTADLIIAEAADVIVGADPPTNTIPGGSLPAPDTINAAAPGAQLWGAGNTVLVDTGGADTIISQPSQIFGGLFSARVGDTVFAAAGGGTYFIGGPDIFAADGRGSSTVIGSVSYATDDKFPIAVPPTIFGGMEDITYWAQPITEGSITIGIGTPTFIFDPQTGVSTVITTTSTAGNGGLNTSAGDAFVHDGGILNVAGSGSANQLVAGPGDATINAAASTGYNTFFASSGNALLVGGSGTDAIKTAAINVSGVPSALVASFETNLFEASSGSTTIVGGSGRDWYQFTSGYAGGADLIQNWDANDQLQFFGYGTNPIASEAVSSGSTFITLSDGTRITIQGISDLNPSQVFSY